MPAQMERSRDRLESGLAAEGFVVLPGQGTYFLTIDLAASGIELDDRSFALHGVHKAGIASIPVSALYEADPVTTILRLCFAKKDETLDGGIARMARARDLIRT